MMMTTGQGKKVSDNSTHPRSMAQRGLTLIEALFWIGGFGIVVAGVIAAASGLFTGLGAGDLDRTFSTVKSEIENNLYAGEATYGNASMLTVLNQSGALPDNWEIDGGGVASIPGGLQARVDGNGQIYSMSVAPLDEGVCAQFVAGLDGQGWNGVDVATGTATPQTSGPDTGTSNINGAVTDGLRVTNISPADAAAACDGGNAAVTVTGGR